MNRQRNQGILGSIINKKQAERLEKNIYKKVQILTGKENNTDLITLYNWGVYQCVGFLLEKDAEYKKILGVVKQGHIGWDSPTYHEAKKKLEERDSYIENPFEVSEGVVECTKCGSMKTYSFQKQLRSGDEGMTTFFICMESDCGAKGRYN